MILDPPKMSSSPSSPSVTPSPFSRLPNELVQQIVENTVPQHYHSQTFSSRQSTLSSLCLVSKLFHQIAKPLLFAVIKVKTLTLTGLWGDHSTARARNLVRELICQAGMKPKNLGQLPVLHSHLRELTLAGNLEMVDLSTLSQLKNLEILKLSGLTLTSSSSFQFSKVTALEVYLVQWAVPSSEIINPTNFPALSALSLGPTSSIEQALKSVGSQLDAYLTCWHGFPEDQIRKVQDKTLFDFYFAFVDSLPSVKHLRLWGDSAKSPAVLEGLLVQLRRTTPKIEPSLIYLPSNPRFDLSPQNQVFAELKSECEKAGAEIIFEEQPGEWRLDSTISQDFWRRMKSRRAEEETV
ncbi:hypothetical protein JCM3765_003177 [Sporobolomyces pararoseus]